MTLIVFAAALAAEDGGGLKLNVGAIGLVMLVVIAAIAYTRRRRDG